MRKEKFDSLFAYLNPGNECENIKYYYSEHHSEEKLPEELFTSPSYSTPESIPGPRSKMKSIDQLFMFLTWLRLGFSLSFTSWLFKTPKSTVSRYLITKSNFMYLKFGTIPIWLNLDLLELKLNMPKCFKETYPKTKVIIDCTEFVCQRPYSLTVQSSMFSHYKHHVTFKGLVGIAPSGAITFVSELLVGSISDIELVKQPRLLQRELLESGDSDRDR
nr:uncharacterized protein LOC105845009 [Hydra vulgaris]